MMAQPQMAASKPATSIAQPIEQYTPPPQQHAAATVPLEIDAKNASPAASGLFLQVGAFANPDAAQLLRTS